MLPFLYFHNTTAQHMLHSSHQDVNASLASLILRYLGKCLALVGLTEAPQLSQPHACDLDNLKLCCSEDSANLIDLTNGTSRR
jgi:hypothetical protein